MWYAGVEGIEAAIKRAFKDMKQGKTEKAVFAKLSTEKVELSVAE